MSRRWFYVVRYDETTDTYELGGYVNGPGADVLRVVIGQLNQMVQLEIKESA